MSAILTAMSQTEQIIVALVIIVAAVAAILLWRTIAPPKYPRKDDGNGEEKEPSADGAESKSEPSAEETSPRKSTPEEESEPRKTEDVGMRTEPVGISADDEGEKPEVDEKSDVDEKPDKGETADSGNPVEVQSGEFTDDGDYDEYDEYDGEYVPFACGRDVGFDERTDAYATPTLDEAFSSDTEGEEPETAESLSEDMANERREGRTKITFVSKLRATTPANRAIYNAVKNEILSYRGTHSRVVNGGDYFRKRGKQLAKIVLIGRTMRLAIALDPADYDYNVYHQHDRSGMKKYADTPMFVKVQSRVGVYRAAKLIADLMEREGKRKNKKYIALDYAREIMLTDTEPVKSAPRDVEYRGEV